MKVTRAGWRLPQGQELRDELMKRISHLFAWIAICALAGCAGLLVVFTSYGGERSTHRLDQQTNPLGPLQGVGEATAAGLIRN